MMNDGEALDAPEPAAAGVPRGRLHQEAVKALREMIVSGELEPGAKLRERELCARLGVSRTPLREAQRILAGERLVQLRANRSAVVSRLDIKEIEEIYQVIARLESLAAELACQRITEEEVAEIVYLQSRMKKAFEKRDATIYIECNQRIHEHVVVASRNDVLIATWRNLSVRARRARRFGLVHADRWPKAVKEHDHMLAALLTRDGALLAQLVVHHFEAGVAAVRQGLAEQGESST